MRKINQLRQIYLEKVNTEHLELDEMHVGCSATPKESRKDVDSNDD